MKVKAREGTRRAPRHGLAGLLVVAGIALTADRESLAPAGPPAGSAEAASLAARSRLPVFELTIGKTDLRKLEASLPEEGWRGARFAGFDSGKWPTVPGTFTYEGRTWPVKVRYRGWNYDHYMKRKKSWRVRFPREDPFFGVPEVNIVNPRERNLVLDLAEHDLLRDMGQLLADQYLVHMRLNGEYAGVQILFEQPCATFLERHGRAPGDLFGEARHNTTPFQDLAWWQKFTSEHHEEDYRPMTKLLAAVNAPPAPHRREELEDLVEVDALLDFMAESVLTAATNPSNHNWRLYVDPSTRRFHVLPWYQFGGAWPLSARYVDAARSRPVDFIYNPLIDLVLAVPAHRDLFHRKLWSLLQGQGQLSRLLARYDEWVDRARPDVYADGNKHSITPGTFEERYYTNGEWEEAVGDVRACLVIRNHYARDFLASCDLSARSSEGAVTLVTTQPIPARVQALELAWDGPAPARLRVLHGGRPVASVAPAGTSVVVPLALELASATARRAVSQDAFLQGALVQREVVPVATEHPLTIEGPPVRVVRVDATNAVTGAPLDGPRRPRAALHAIEVPLAVADDEPPARRGGHRLAFYTAHPRPLTVEALELAWEGDVAARVTVLEERFTPGGEVEERPLASARRRRGATLTLSRQVSGRPDTFPRGAHDPPGPSFVPTVTELRVRVEGAVEARLVGVRARDGTAPVDVVVEPAPSLAPVPVRHSRPGFDPVPPRPEAKPSPRLRPAPPSTSVAWSGTVRVTEDLRLDARTTLTIAPGTRVELAPGASIVVRGRLEARGTRAAPITFTWQAPGRPWGVLALRTGRETENVVEHCRFEGGGQDVVDDVAYTGALSAHACAVQALACAFTDCAGDDALSIRSSDGSLIRGCSFEGVEDGVDLDLADAVIEACTFEGPRGDAIDLSGSRAVLRGNVIRGARDKGVSVGERSAPLLIDNVITGCAIGVAVKDSSQATIAGDTIVGNATGVSLYVGKKHFGGASAELRDTIVWGNHEAGLYLDGAARVSVSHCVLQPQVRGDGGLELGPGVRRDDPGLRADLGLRDDSPCRGAGSGDATDGGRRVDIGARR